MKETITIIFYILLFIGIVVLLGFEIYLFYEAPCEEVKQWWLITRTPARCI